MLGIDAHQEPINGTLDYLRVLKHSVPSIDQPGYRACMRARILKWTKDSRAQETINKSTLHQDFKNHVRYLMCRQGYCAVYLAIILFLHIKYVIDSRVFQKELMTLRIRLHSMRRQSRKASLSFLLSSHAYQQQNTLQAIMSQHQQSFKGVCSLLHLRRQEDQVTLRQTDQRREYLLRYYAQ